MQEGSIIAKRFRILARAGSGGFGTVYRALDLETERDVALKVLDAPTGDFVRFEREAEILATVRHPYVVGYLASGRASDDAAYLAMEWLEGMDLEKRLADGPLDVDEALRLVLRAAQGLGAAHAHGVVHRDVKPSNLFLVGGSTDHVRVIDFGIARTSVMVSKLTATGIVLGTPAYMSPDQAAGEREVGPASDVFSLGAVLFECLTGKRLYDGPNAHAVLGKILAGRLPDWSELADAIPRLVQMLLVRMLAYEAADRLPNAEVVAVAIASILADRTNTPRILQAPVPVSNRQRRVASRVIVRGEEGAAIPESVSATLLAEGAQVLVSDVHQVVAGYECAAAAIGAERAARVALGIARGNAALRIGIATGPADNTNTPDLGAVRPGSVWLDTPTARYLDRSFEVVTESGASILVGTRARPATRVAPLVGRSQEVSTLEGIVESSITESVGRLALVLGEAGCGKSRLLDTVIEAVAEHHPSAFIARAQAESPTRFSPFAIVAQLAAARIALQDRVEPRQVQGTLIEQGMTSAEAVWACELAGLRDRGTEHRDRRGVSDPLAVADGFRSGWLALVERTSEVRPFVMVVEDLHWADPASLQLLDAALAESAERPVTIVASLRSNEASDVVRMLEARQPDKIELKPLRAKPAADLVRHHEPDATDERVKSVLDRAQGNPLRIEQLLLLGEDEPGADSLRGAIEIRLARLSAGARRVLRAASVFGVRFSRAGLVALLSRELSSDELTARLREAADADFTSADGGDTDVGLTFRHALLRDAAYASLPEDERRSAHTAVAAFYERSAGWDAPLIAWHYEQAHESKVAMVWYERAARRMLEGDDLPRALDLVGRALACDPSPDQRAELLLLRAEASLQRGDPAAGDSSATEAMSIARPGSATWARAAGLRITCLGQRGENAEVIRIGEELRAQAAEPDAVTSRVIGLCRASSQLTGEVHQRFFDAAAAEPVSDPVVRGWLARLRGAVPLREQDYATFLRHNHDSIACYEAVGDMRAALLQRIHNVSGYAFMGDFDSARAEVDVALMHARRTGAAYLARWAEYARGKILAQTADPAVARAHLERVRRDVAGSPRIVAGTHLYCAIAAFRASDPQWAAQEAEAALAVHQATAIVIAAAAVQARAYAMQGAAPAALESARRATEGLAAIDGLLEEHKSLVYLAPIEAAQCAGDMEAARAAARIAVSRLLSVAGRLDSPVRREAFLRAIEVHDRTLRLASELGVYAG